MGGTLESSIDRARGASMDFPARKDAALSRECCLCGHGYGIFWEAIAIWSAKVLCKAWDLAPIS